MRQSCHRLSFALENNLASTLAFLAGEDDPDFVPALCIHEVTRIGYLNVLIAVNTKHAGEDLPASRRIKDRLDHIFDSLSIKTSKGLSANKIERLLITKVTELKVYSIIVSACSDRILSRLGYTVSKHGKQRKSIDKLLRHILQLNEFKFEKFREASLQVIDFAERWGSRRTDNTLEKLVSSVVCLSRIPDVSGQLETIQNTSMDPSERDSLLRMILAVARYRDSATFLYREAKKDSLFQNLRTTLVELPSEAFYQPSAPYLPQFWNACERIGITATVHQNMHTIRRPHSASRTPLEDLFANQCRETMSNGKIHAEMQLVYHIETLEATAKPRVIASSKMACFLCNAFLCETGKFHMRHTHGRLHPGWKMPLFPQGSDLGGRFVKHLQSRVRSDLDALIQSKKCTIYNMPMESALWPMQISNTTIQSIGNSQGDLSADSMVVLEQGKGKKIRPVPSGTTNVQAGAISLFIEHSIASEQFHPRPLCYLEWLADDDAIEIKAEKPLSVTDAETLDAEVSIPKSQQEEMYLDVKGCVLRVSII